MQLTLARPLVVPWTAVALTVITSLGFALRLLALESRPLWTDELGQVFAAQHSDMFHVVRTMAAGAPADFFGTRLALALAPGYEYAARLWPLVIGTLTIPVLYATARAWGGSGLLAAGLLAVLPFHVYYSTEARPYALAILATVLILWAYRERQWLGLGAASLLGLLTFYPVGLLVACLGVALVVRREWRGVAALCAAGLLMVPWLVYASHRPDAITWDIVQPDLLSAAWVVLTGQLHVAALFVVPAALVAVWRHRDPDWLALGAFALLAIPAMWIAGGVMDYWWHERHVTPLLPVLLVVAAGLIDDR